MRCDDVAINLPDYILGMVEPNLKKSIESHLEGCMKCRTELEEMREPIKVLGQMEKGEYPDGFWQELRASIMEKVSERRPARWRVPAFAGGLAVVLIAVGIGIYEYSFHPTQRVQSVAMLATSLPSDQAVDLPNLNVNYINTSGSMVSEAENVTDVDDSLQEAVVKSLWASVADSTATMDYLDYPSISN